MTSPGLTFLSWLRTGLAGSIEAPPGAGPDLLAVDPPLTAALPVQLTLAADTTASFTPRLASAADAVGIDPAQVIRTDPPPGARDVPPNYLPLIEFHHPDLPFLLTPLPPQDATAPTAIRGLRPWLCLVIVTDRALEQPAGTRPLPRLTAELSELPDLDTVWLWAHAQVLTSGAAGETITDVVSKHPERTLSRLLAPYRLRPNTSYLACVVPTFEAGRRAGLDESPAQGATTLGRAWPISGQLTVELPVYHSWRFATGAPGDIEQLARRLHAADLEVAGIRPLDVGFAGPGLPGPAPGEDPWWSSFEGVALGHDVQPGAWPQSWATHLRAALATRLDATPDQLTPPVYGRRLIGPTAAPAWLAELNTDPRYRALAALGTRVVQQYQDVLVSSAWAQTAQLREANQLLRRAQLAQAVSTVLHQRLTGSDDDRLLQLTGPLHGVLPAGTGTVAGALATNVTLAASVGVPFRRIARPRGPLARRLSAVPLPAPVQRLGLDPADPERLLATPELAPAGGAVELDRVSVEGMAALTPERAKRPVLAWEAAPGVVTPGRRGVPTAFLADLLVSTVTPPVDEGQPARWTATLGRALDFDGVPRLGWEQLSNPPATAIGLDGGAYRATYVDTPKLTGLLSVSRSVRYERPLYRHIFSYSWEPRHMQDAARYPARWETIDSTYAESGRWSQSEALVAAGDIRGSGDVDVLFVGVAGNRSHVGFGLRADGTFAGGLVSVPLKVRNQTSVAIAARTIFVLEGSTLSRYTMDVHYRDWYYGARETIVFLTPANPVDLQPMLPPDFRGGAIVAADFGGSTGVDLLVFSVAGRGRELRGTYRVAFDMQYDGHADWGPHQTPPIPVAGIEVGVLLGALRPGADDVRRASTDEFRTAAARVLERQQRILPVSVPPPPPPPVPTATLAAEVAAATDPARTVPAATAARLQLAKPIPATVTDPLQPLELTPRFRFPTYELLRDAAPDRLVPGGSGLADDSVAALVVNTKAVEAFLVGLNHELGNELRWRGFPLRYGSYFQHFWSPTRPDIPPIEDWGDTDLGTHAPPGRTGQTLLLIVRAELLRRYPDLTVQACPAIPDGATGRKPHLQARERPTFTGRLSADVGCYGFDLTEAEARGSDGGQDGWFFLFQEHPTAPRFGLDEPDADRATTYGGTPATWSDLDWNHLVTTEPDAKTLAHIDGEALTRLVGVTRPDHAGANPLSHTWGVSAADMAHITLQRPFVAAIHARRLLGVS